MLSRAYGEVQLTKDAFARLYRQDFNLPYLNRSDSRMIPNTHEAYIVRRPGERFEFILGHVSKMKRKESDRFVRMGEIAGVRGSKSGTSIFGVRGSATDSISLGVRERRPWRVHIAWVAFNTFTLRLTGYGTDALQETLRTSARSFRRLTKGDRAAIERRQIGIATTIAGESLAGFSARVGNHLNDDLTRAINDIEGGALENGRLKILEVRPYFDNGD